MCPWLGSLHGVCPAGAALGFVLDVLLGALLQLGDILVRGAVGLDSLLTIRGELRLPVALARLLLGERVLLVLVVIFNFCAEGKRVSNGLLQADGKMTVDRLGRKGRTTRGLLYTVDR